MGKILYPVGTLVKVKKFPDSGPAVVTEYHKGEKYPYRVSSFPERKFSIKGLKRYNRDEETLQIIDCEDNTCEMREPVEAQDVGVTPVTREEVQEMIAKQYVGMLELMSAVDDIAYKALLKTNRLGSIMDANFASLDDKLNALRHDDD